MDRNTDISGGRLEDSTDPRSIKTCPAVSLRGSPRVSLGAGSAASPPPARGSMSGFVHLRAPQPPGGCPHERSLPAPGPDPAPPKSQSAAEASAGSQPRESLPGDGTGRSPRPSCSRSCPSCLARPPSQTSSRLRKPDRRALGLPGQESAGSSRNLSQCPLPAAAPSAG